MVEFLSGENEACGRLLLRPNQSSGWRANQRFWIACLLVSGSVAVYWAIQGLLLILAFAGLELLLLFWALHRVSRDCYRQELLELTPETVRVLAGHEGPESEYCYQRYSTRVKVEREKRVSGERKRLWIYCRDQKTEFGAFLTEPEKTEVLRHLQRMVDGYRQRYLARDGSVLASGI